MAIYKINTTTVTGSATNTIISQDITMVLETIELLTGQVFESDGLTPAVGAAVVLYETLIESPNTVTQQAIAYTDANGEYGFPYDFDTTTYTYSLKIYTPNATA